MIGFNLDFVADTSDLDADDSEEEEEVEDVELEGSEIPLGSTTFAACFEARTLQKVCKLMFLKMQPVDIFLRLSHLLPPLEYAVMQFGRTMPRNEIATSDQGDGVRLRLRELCLLRTAG